ncbi:methyltransferase domain-containing protein [Brevibacillus sp. 179-C9.3 HS]|uniref:class I SAM-dependent methyltransferase n=1 Tax=unclassified Brevibacillus TaxID=2684853 RepID=UPI0039A32C66
MSSHEEIKQAVQKQFGKNAEQYVKSKTHATGSDLELIVQWMQPAANWRALDIATGGGHVARTLAPHVSLVVATDLTRPMLMAASAANRQALVENVLYVQADAESLPFLDESFEIVTCRIAAHHFPDPAAFVREVSRVLTPGGLLLFIDNVSPEEPSLCAFVNEVEKRRDPSHVRCLCISEWRALFEANHLFEQKQQLRKKQFAFLPWVQRTSESPEQEAAVEKMLLEATDEQKAYLGLTVEEGRVLTHQIDEWMVLCNKRGGKEDDDQKA